jgi:DDE superfamily endonuclease
VALFLPGRAHDALNRLLRVMPLSTRALMRLLIGWVGRSHRQEGYLCLDDVVVEKAFARKLPWAGWTYSFAKKRKLYGLHVVVLLWCASEGSLRIPVAFRLWRPKRSCAARA